MINHVCLKIRDHALSKQFYQLALKPIGYKLLVETEFFSGFGRDDDGSIIPSFWLHHEVDQVSCAHVAFSGSSQRMVEQFYNAAILAGGRCNGRPGIRKAYHPNYYAAFILDPDGNNIEVVCY